VIQNCSSSRIDIKTAIRLTKHLLLSFFRPQRYLIKDPIALLSAGWLDLQMDGNIQSYIEEYTSNQNSAESNTSKYGPRNAIPSLNTWKVRLTPAEKKRVIFATREIARKIYDEFA